MLLGGALTMGTSLLAGVGRLDGFLDLTRAVEEDEAPGDAGRPDAAQVHALAHQLQAHRMHLLGIEHEQALELFHQTVSMKSVGNLTDFVRSHMLEPFDVASRIEALIRHFDDLDRAHQAVLKAKRQVALLTPLVEDGQRHQALVAEIENWRDGRDALQPYFARLKGELLERRLGLLAQDAARLDAQIERLFTDLSAVWPKFDGFVHAIGFAPREAIAGDFLDGLSREAFRIAREEMTAEGERIRVFLEHWGVDPENRGPGGFLPGITPENVLWRQAPRNRRIADSVARATTLWASSWITMEAKNRITAPWINPKVKKAA